MTLRPLMLGTAMAALIAVAPQFTPATSFGITPAHAATQVNVNFSVGNFYDRLASDGDWVSYQNKYVFVPNNISADWRPYTVGHWVYARQYGWIWASDEPFGWATYHYGRWGYADEIGWYWVPGTRWAPAWVAWKRSDRYLAWAPLPPEGGTEVNINIDIGSVPRNYWVAVPAARFLETDLSRVYVRDESQVVTIVDRAEPVGTVKIENNIVVNNVVNVDDIQKETNQKVVERNVTTVDNPDQSGKMQGDQIQVFNPEVKADKEAKPKEARNIDEVARKHKQQTTGGADQQQQQQQGATTGTTNENSTQQKTGESTDQLKKKKDQTGTTEQTTTPGTTGTVDESTGTQMKKKGQTGETTGTTQGEDQSTLKKKKKSSGSSGMNTNEGAGQTTGTIPDEQQAGKKKKLQQKLQQQEGTTGAPSDQQQMGNDQAPTKKKEKPSSDQSGSMNGGYGKEQGQTTGTIPTPQEKKKKLPGSTESSGSSDQALPQQQDSGGQVQGGGKKKKGQACDPSTGNCQ